MNHGTFFFNQKEIFIPLQFSEATFHDSVNKQAKPKPNRIKTLPSRSMGLNMFIINKIAVFSYSCTEQGMLDLLSFTTGL